MIYNLNKKDTSCIILQTNRLFVFHQISIFHQKRSDFIQKKIFQNESYTVEIIHAYVVPSQVGILCTKTTAVNQ